MRANRPIMRGAHARRRDWRRAVLAGLLTSLLAVPALAPSRASLAQEVRGAEVPRAKRTLARAELARLFDAVVATTAKEFWDKDRLAAVGWDKRAAEVRQSVVQAASLREAAARINALLGELKTSHTALLTPDDVDYYVLLSVFERSGRTRELVAERFWGAGVTYAGIGVFSVRNERRDFVEAVLEGSPADRAGIKVGDEIVAVDAAPYHPVRSFRGKVGRKAAVTVRRSADAEPDVLSVPVASVAPLVAFREATRASARVIERDGQRVAYVHVWASVGEDSAKALSDALSKLGIGQYYEPGASNRPPPIDGLIIDMRGRIGGTAENAGRYLELIDPRGPRVRSVTAKSLARTFMRGRTAVLINHRTRSTAELFVHAYKRERQGPLIGTRTAGAVSAGAAFAMPGGNLLYLAVTGLEVDGEIVEGVGVAPDIEVARPVPYAQGADPVLEAAVADLVGRVKPSSPTGRDVRTDSQ